MKTINIREALLDIDRDTFSKYDLTSLYEACNLDEKDKHQLVQYIASYEEPANIGKFLESKCNCTEGCNEPDDISEDDMKKIIDDVNEGSDHTFWELMDEADKLDEQLKKETDENKKQELQQEIDTLRDEAEEADDHNNPAKATRLQVEADKLEEDFDKQYGQLSSQMDADSKELQRLYLTGEYSPCTALLHLGYEEDGDHLLVKDNGDGYVQVFDFTSFDLDGTEHFMYYVLKDGEIPQGWTSTKVVLQEPIEECLTENAEYYIDKSGIMGEVGATYTVDDLEKIWADNSNNDPSMKEYRGDYGSWLKDTLSYMEIQESVEDDEFEFDDEFKSYYNGYTEEDKDKNSAFNKLKDNVAITESSDEKEYCIVAITADGERKFYKDGKFVDDYNEATTWNDLDEAREEWFDIDKSKYKRVFVPVYDREAFAAFDAPVKEAVEEDDKPYTYEQIFDELKRETKNFTVEDCGKYGFKEEAEMAVKILEKHYASVELDKVGSWFQVEFKDVINKK